jgi:hypothetical protein
MRRAGYARSATGWRTLRLPAQTFIQTQLCTNHLRKSTAHSTLRRLLFLQAAQHSAAHSATALCSALRQAAMSSETRQPKEQVPAWVEEYNKALTKRVYSVEKKPGPHCCASECGAALTPCHAPPARGTSCTPHSPLFSALSSFFLRCPVCCSFFASFGSLFLFLIASLMRNHYPYIHIEGDLDKLATPVAYAGERSLSASAPLCLSLPVSSPLLTHPSLLLLLLFSLLSSLLLPDHCHCGSVLLVQRQCQGQGLGGCAGPCAALSAL